MIVVTAPNQPPKSGLVSSLTTTEVFLAGSIEMGKARDWQQDVIARYRGVKSLTLFNPRRADWDPSWAQSPTNERLLEQIDWELEHLERADYVFFYFQGDTMSPVTMMELGLALNAGTDMIVVCEPGFWREANVVRTCERSGIEVYTTIEEGLEELDLLLGV